jgi:HSP20 family molecular chaperone IbpA
MFFKKIKKDIVLEEPSDGRKQQSFKLESLSIPTYSKPQTPASKKPITPIKEVPNKKEEVAVSSLGIDNAEWLKVKGQLVVDVYQADGEFCIQAPIAGVEPNDISIALEKDMLIIKGERKEPDKEKSKHYFYQECYFGQFARQIILPEDADKQNVRASLKKGVLTIKIPKVSREQKQIKINVEE